jgi:hypothetical protein
VKNGQLTIENVQKSTDGGTYNCTAWNKHNQTSFATVDVKVLGKNYE